MVAWIVAMDPTRAIVQPQVSAVWVSSVAPRVLASTLGRNATEDVTASEVRMRPRVIIPTANVQVSSLVVTESASLRSRSAMASLTVAMEVTSLDASLKPEG